MKAIVTMFPQDRKSHFAVVLVSDRFTGERFLNRHRMIYGTLTAEPPQPYMRYTSHTYTPQRVGRVADTIFASPPCRGKWKHRAAKRICNYLRFSSMLLQNYVKTACGRFMV